MQLELSSQRWFQGRHSFRLSREPINPTEFAAEPVDYATAKSFVLRHHYSGSFSPSMASFGLFRKAPHSPPRLVGVATFAPCSNIRSMERWTGLDFHAGAELSRFVLLDEVAGNGETWFLSRALAAFKVARPQVKVVLSYSDPVPRTRLDGSILFCGHWGSIYQSSNSLYLGRASPKTQFISADGRVIANRILSKLRNAEVGRAYAERVLADIAGIVREEGESPSCFADRALSLLRAHRHPGNHLYAFPLAMDRREKRAILSLPILASKNLGVGSYPKRVDDLRAA